MHLVTPNGRSVGFAKVGWSELTTSLVKHEANLLRTVEQNYNGPLLETPKVVAEFEWNSGIVVVTTPLPLNPLPSKTGFTQKHFKAIYEIGGTRRLAFAELDLVGDVESVRDHVNINLLKNRYQHDIIQMLSLIHI